MICTDRKVLFLHVPRTAGTSITRALSDVFGDQENGSTHWTLADYAARYDLSGYLVAMVVRNPWDHVVSFFEYRRQRGFETTVAGDAEECPTFRSFGLRDTNFALRFERLDEDFRRLCNRIGIEAPELPKINWRPRQFASYRDYYDARTKDCVAQRYELTRRTFGYSF